MKTGDSVLSLLQPSFFRQSGGLFTSCDYSLRQLVTVLLGRESVMNPYCVLASLLLALSLLAGPASAEIRLNEIMMNPPGSDSGLEYFELVSTTGGVESLAGITLLVLEGDTNAATEGRIDDAESVNSFSTGANGLFLSREGGSGGANPVDPLVYSPQPDPQTVVDINSLQTFQFENGAITFLLVSNFSGSNGDDLDANNDGTLDETPWDSVLDAVAILDDNNGGREYATQLGGVVFPQQSFTPGLLFRELSTGAWLAAGLVDNQPEPGGPYEFESEELVNTTGNLVDPSTAFSVPVPTSTPGVVNPSFAAGNGLLGDFNGDLIVNGADYATWRNALPGGPIANDGDSGAADPGDLDDWRQAFGNSQIGSAVAVPEPSGLPLTAMISSLPRLRRCRAKAMARPTAG